MFDFSETNPFSLYRPALVLAAVTRGRLFVITRWLVFALLLISVTFALVLSLGAIFTLGLGDYLILEEQSQWWGLVAIALAIYLSMLAPTFYVNYYYFRGLDRQIHSTVATTSGAVYEVAELVYKDQNDITAAFCRSSFGQTVLRRCEFTVDDVVAYMSAQRTAVTIDTLVVPTDAQLTLHQLAMILFTTDTSFAGWFQSKGVTPETYQGAVAWTYKEHLYRKRKAQWWSKDNLSRSSGIGREFSYGVAFTLNAFTKPLTIGAVYADAGGGSAVTREYTSQIETLLARSRDANVLLTGEPGVGKNDILITVARRLEYGGALGSVGKHLVALDTERLLALAGDKAVFEQTFLQLLQGAEKAGNIVLVITDLPEFLRSARAYQVDIPSLMGRFLNSPEMQVVATASIGEYHTSIETEGELLRRFEVVQIESPEQTAVVDLIESLVVRYEETNRLYFSYPAVVEIVTTADRYLVNGVMPDKAVQLLDEIAVSARADGLTHVTAANIDTYVAKKTGVPVGPISTGERETLLNLEAVLHENIIGQEAAIAAISNVMRRSRAGVQDTGKPIGTFMFLGPTGVGKTESAKTLAKTFFQTEEAMLRFDMSEFSGPDAVARLIGTATTPGTFSNALKEKPYAVVLLDEFEKANVEVHNLFLQILDEGMFTDGRGQRINARNSIIIATSNAGSDLIMDWLAAGVSLQTKKDELVDTVVVRGLYKPELINRFDEVVMFTPLNEPEQTQIAKAMLEDLRRRLTEKGYHLVVTEPLIQKVVSIGYEPKYGARPMRRAVQDVVESAVAEKIIAGSLQRGGQVTFTAAELAQL